MGKLKKLADLEISEQYKKILAQLSTPRSTAQVAAKLGLGYSTVSQRLCILAEMGHATKIQTMSGKTLYMLKNLEV